MQVITSKDNEIVKSSKKVKEKKYRDETDLYLIEGIKIIKEAIDEKAIIRKIVICDECIQETDIDQRLLYTIAKYDCIYVSKKVFDLLTTVVNPQGILAVVEKPNRRADINYDEDVILILDGIQDPGNLGTILRTLDSVNLKQVIVSKKTADVYNPKVVRSTMGAIFRVNVIEENDLISVLKNIRKNKFKILATSLEDSTSIYETNFKKKAIVIGNEANGVSKEIMEIADDKIKIPMIGKTESLNASVATGIILYEYLRKKLY